MRLVRINSDTRRRVSATRKNYEVNIAEGWNDSKFVPHDVLRQYRGLMNATEQELTEMTDLRRAQVIQNMTEAITKFKIMVLHTNNLAQQFLDVVAEGGNWKMEEDKGETASEELVKLMKLYPFKDQPEIEEEEEDEFDDNIISRLNQSASVGRLIESADDNIEIVVDRDSLDSEVLGEQTNEWNKDVGSHLNGGGRGRGSRGRGKRGRRSMSRGRGRGRSLMSFGFAGSKKKVRLTFHVVRTLVSTALTPYAGYYFSPAYGYDVDPAIGSTAQPGFTEWGVFDRKYRLLRSKIITRFTNTDPAVPASVFLLPINFVPTFTSTATINSYLSQPVSKTANLGLATGDSGKILSKVMTVAGFGGARYLGVEDDYCALTSGGAPVNQLYWALGMQTNTSANVGVYVDIEIISTYEFYEVSTLSV